MRISLEAFKKDLPGTLERLRRYYSKPTPRPKDIERLLRTPKAQAYLRKQGYTITQDDKEVIFSRDGKVMKVIKKDPPTDEQE